MLLIHRCSENIFESIDRSQYNQFIVHRLLTLQFNKKSIRYNWKNNFLERKARVLQNGLIFLRRSAKILQVDGKKLFWNFLDGSSFSTKGFVLSSGIDMILSHVLSDKCSALPSNGDADLALHSLKIPA